MILPPLFIALHLCAFSTYISKCVISQTTPEQLAPTVPAYNISP
jgi:hypothetical protein